MSGLMRYTVAALTVIAIALAQEFLWLPRHPEWYLLAVAASALLGGVRVGVFALGLSLVAFIALVHPAGVPLSERLLRTLLFFAASLLVLALISAWCYGVRRNRELEERERELEKALAEVQASMKRVEMANLAKERFLAILSHELRTPLTPVLLAAEGLQHRSDLPTEARREIAMIRHHIRLEARLIDDLLDFTRFEKGSFRLDRSHENLHEMIEAAIRIVSDDAARRQVRVLFQPDAARPCVNVDRPRVKQVILNLLNNALKFTPKGGTVTLTTSNRGEMLNLSVADTGIGIAPEALDLLFDAFENIDADQHRFGGIGIGLAVARKVVELHGGIISAASDGPGKGAMFTFTLPTSTQVPEVTLPDTSHLRILLVEDHEPTAFILSRLLKRRGHAVQMATNRHEAFSFDREPIDLLVSDIGLPDGSGIDVVRHYREVQQDFKAIALSGYGMETDVKRSLDAGFDRHVTKPVDFEALQHAIGELFEEKA